MVTNDMFEELSSESGKFEAGAFAPNLATQMGG